MFGYDDRELERIRRGRVVRWWVLLLELVAAALLVLPVAAFWLVAHPEHIRSLVVTATTPGPVTVDLDDVALIVSDPWSPSTWWLQVERLSVTPDDPDKAGFVADRVSLSFPDLARLSTGEVASERGRVVGLSIHARRQRAEKWEVRPAPLRTISVGHVSVWGGRFRAEPDPPLGEAEMTGIWGDLTDVSYNFWNRELDARGAVRASRFVTGSIEVSSVAIGSLVSKKSTLDFNGTVRWTGRPVTIDGHIAGFHRRGPLTLKAAMQGGRLEKVIESATGAGSPIRGEIDLNLVVHSGGDLPRGKSWMEGDIAVRDGRVPLPPDTKAIVLDLIRIAPWVDLSDKNEVLLHDAKGTLRLDRGSVDIGHLEYAGKRPIHVRGHVDASSLDLVVRIVPAKNADERAGLGIVVTGSPEKPEVRLARRDELLPGVYVQDEAGVVRHKDEPEPLVKRPLFGRKPPVGDGAGSGSGSGSGAGSGSGQGTAPAGEDPKVKRPFRLFPKRDERTPSAE